MKVDLPDFMAVQEAWAVTNPHDRVLFSSLRDTRREAIEQAIAIWEPRRLYGGRVVAIKDRWRWLRRQGWRLCRVVVVHAAPGPGR